MPEKIELLFFIHGAPEKINDVPTFVKNILGTRATESVIRENVKRYKTIGGSPHARISRLQATQLEKYLAARGVNTYVHLVALHWNPRLKDVRKYIKDSIVVFVSTLLHTKAVLVPYEKELKDAEILYSIAAPFHRDERLIRYLAKRLKKQAKEDAFVIFTVHSLPGKFPGAEEYAEEAHRLARIVAHDAGVKNFHLAFQSAPPGASGWLRPSVKEVLNATLSRHRVKMHIVFMNLNFCTENAETLYDLDVAAKEEVENKGFAYSRIPQPNDDSEFIHIIGDFTLEHIRRHFQR